jgi:hypothetical protein
LEVIGAPGWQQGDKQVSRSAFTGGLNASPWRSFHPDSSWASSGFSSWLYMEMSRYRVPSMIMATITERKRTVIREFPMVNQ